MNMPDAAHWPGQPAEEPDGYTCEHVPPPGGCTVVDCPNYDYPADPSCPWQPYPQPEVRT